MSIERLYADGIERDVQRMLLNPGPAPQADSFSLWSMVTAGAKGLPTAGLETSGSVADVLSGFATAAAASGGTGQGMFSVPTADEAKQEAEARDRMLQSKAFDTSAGAALRRKADEFAPDPQTSHKADQVVHGLVRGVGKAVGDVVLLGPAGGAVAFGLDEGNTAAQRLIEQGVDAGTAAKVGAVTGVVQGSSVAIPGVGPTVGKTIGLALGTGPVSFMAQEKATREILQRANYGELAAQHDPLDPLGLTLSTILPGVVGGIHVRGLKKAASLQDVVQHIESGGRRYGPDGKLLTSPKGAQGEMQVMPATALDPGFGITPARDSSPEELARVGREYLAAMQQRYSDPEKALAAYNAGPGAVDKAVAKHGEAWLAHMPDETKAYVAKANKLMGDHVAAKGAEDPAVVDAARVRVTDEALMRNMPETPTARADVMAAADEVGAGRMPDIPEAVPYEQMAANFERWFEGSRVVDESGAPIVMYHGSPDPNIESFRPGAFFTENVERANGYTETKSGKTDGGTMYPVVLAIRKPIKVYGTEFTQVPGWKGKTAHDFAYDADLRAMAESDGGWDGVIAYDPLTERPNLVIPFRSEQVKSATGNSGKFDPNSPSLTDPLGPVKGGQRADTQPSTLPPPDRVGLEPEAPAAAAAAKSDAEPGAVDQARLKSLLDERPDMPVRLPGSEETVSVQEALLRAHEAYDDEVSVADLVKVAAECFLANGV
jgi:hypothetical protein